MKIYRKFIHGADRLVIDGESIPIIIPSDVENGFKFFNIDLPDELVLITNWILINEAPRNSWYTM